MGESLPNERSQFPDPERESSGLYILYSEFFAFPIAVYWQKGIHSSVGFTFHSIFHPACFPSKSFVSRPSARPLEIGVLKSGPSPRANGRP